MVMLRCFSFSVEREIFMNCWCRHLSLDGRMLLCCVSTRQTRVIWIWIPAINIIGQLYKNSKMQLEYSKNPLFLNLLFYHLWNHWKVVLWQVSLIINKLIHYMPCTYQPFFSIIYIFEIMKGIRRKPWHRSIGFLWWSRLEWLGHTWVWKKKWIAVTVGNTMTWLNGETVLLILRQLISNSFLDKLYFMLLSILFFTKSVIRLFASAHMCSK